MLRKTKKNGNDPEDQIFLSDKKKERKTKCLISRKTLLFFMLLIFVVLLLIYIFDKYKKKLGASLAYVHSSQEVWDSLHANSELGTFYSYLLFISDTYFGSYYPGLLP